MLNTDRHDKKLATKALLGKPAVARQVYVAE
jgi:hypothetical protein